MIRPKIQFWFKMVLAVLATSVLFSQPIIFALFHFLLDDLDKHNLIELLLGYLTLSGIITCFILFANCISILIVLLLEFSKKRAFKTYCIAGMIGGALFILFTFLYMDYTAAIYEQKNNSGTFKAISTDARIPQGVEGGFWAYITGMILFTIPGALYTTALFAIVQKNSPSKI